MESVRFVVLVDDRCIVVIDKTKVREILGEHNAPFPAMFNVSSDNPGWKTYKLDNDVGGVHFGGGINKEGRYVPARIWIKHDAFTEVNQLRRIIVHELRHWWQHANPERRAGFYPKPQPAITRLWNKIKALGWISALAMFLGLILVGGLCWSGLWWVALFVVCFLVLLWSLLLDDFGLEKYKKPVERDAYGYVDEHGNDPEWKEAIFIIRNDELTQLRQTIDRLNDVFGSQKLKSDP